MLEGKRATVGQKKWINRGCKGRTFLKSGLEKEENS